MIGRGYLPIILVTLLIAATPLVISSNSFFNFTVLVLIIALAAQGWNLLGGIGGQTSFGHSMFFGIGAYTASMLQTHLGVNAWLSLVAAIAAGALAGLIVGFLSFRAGLRGSYFALVTLAFAELLRVLANASELTGGAAGLLLKLDLGFANMQFSSRPTFMLLALVFVFASLVITQKIVNSRFGAHLVAVRENEDAAKALGVDVLTVKLKAISLSGAMTAAAGVLYVQYFLYIDAGIAFGIWISIEALLAPMVGGRGMVLGPLIGAFTLHGLGEITKSFAGRVPGIDLIVFTIVLIVVIAFASSGILGLLKKLADRFSSKGGA
ncbi:branched-chain amino acid ABC transporter permease [Neorhizobium petrolearium]|uniref:Branched-chain amino acid ABC transporter permease n=1 Tax=Neorhizobium petrolearium TaxID=515361 RepID=A0ABY8MAB8_9HYPH|nr:branched-chain amino acid ABC transporter permease [Neorhizobium petrolearium]MCC2613891.1 branched-chain amino acid ABC transporter permease [Neorhizobium petrolearium]WGI71414.1 branched-chain amino acid ABC transporter permease [Neorhizobium petrolearium]